jgi:hypothetical protein
MIGNIQKDDLILAHKWIATNTPVDALFVIFPEDVSFSCQAKRSVVVSPHAFVHKPDAAIHWYQLYSNVYGVTLENNQHHFRKNRYINLQSNVLPNKNIYVLYRNGIDSIISSMLKPLYQNQSYTVAFSIN